ncbi:YajC [Candidatus Omnitrophus magneticus]|uniref:Sec translocon accessory complex subunit YajC n=1 Tax=Candidatus Omnitrophus magneticus TaxID=1609969 RepID=A0A0F0CP71_9BACT|nr:YajC [Candidatus Omnitrophus magneticus]
MFTLAFAQSAQQVSQTAGLPEQNPIATFAPIILIFIVFYFLLIRPQKKTQKAHADMIKNLKKNDEVVTTSGIHGTILNIQDDVITLRIDDDVKIRIQKNSIAYLKSKPVAEVVQS